MIKLRTPTPDAATLADLLQRLGDVPPERIRLYRPLGSATEQDVIDIEARENRLCELVDGVLVEKTVGYYEARLALLIGHFLEDFLEQHDLGIVLGADGTLRLMPGLVRIPDVSFISWDRLPNRELPAEPIPDLVPDLAVEVLSEGNTVAEMRRKLAEYFRVGVRMVWFIDPTLRSAEVYTALNRLRRINEEQILRGGRVLPGFSLRLGDLFARAGKRRS
ncbi:MAG TPA: Uma2 family endonuclease [Gemmataceae bacterium]|jgi:Uma2 family endonuclease|nr:Uma2 family endonuclease [Gemmataceae bacterium]